MPLEIYKIFSQFKGGDSGNTVNQFCGVDKILNRTYYDIRDLQYVYCQFKRGGVGLTGNTDSILSSRQNIKYELIT